MEGMDFKRAEELLGQSRDYGNDELKRDQDKAMGFLIVNIATSLASIAADLGGIRKAVESIDLHSSGS